MVYVGPIEKCMKVYDIDMEYIPVVRLSIGQTWNIFPLFASVFVRHGVYSRYLSLLVRRGGYSSCLSLYWSDRLYSR
jgi:hypothetical protein